eukprot:Gb_39699 [translate_table: standard]
MTRTRAALAKLKKEKMAVFFLGLQLPFEIRKTSIQTMTASLKSEGNTYNSSVRTLCKQGRLKEALRILHVMKQHVDSYPYDIMLQCCLNNKVLPQGKLVHANMIQTGFNWQDISLGNKLATVYGKYGSMVDARRVFDEMAERDVVSWTAMITAYSRHGLAEEALALFLQMQRTGIQPNEFTFASVLPACAKLAALEQGMEIHEEIIRTGFQSDVFVENALVDMYAKLGSIEKARDLFDKMPERDVVSWNAMIAGYAQNGHFDEALKLFQEMPERDMVSWNAMIAGYAQNGHVDEALKLFQKIPRPDVVSWNAMIAGYAQNGHAEKALKLFQQMQVAGLKLDSKTFASVLTACGRLGVLEVGMEIHEEIIRNGLQFDVLVENALVDMYGKCGSLETARDLFDKMPKRDIVSWNTIIAGHAQNKYGEEALRLFQQMQLKGVKPNPKTFASVLPACASLAALEQGMEIHGEIIRSGFLSDVFVESALIDMYAKCGSIEKARDVFDKMLQRNDISWTAMIAGYAMHGCGKEALELFQEMQASGMNPNHVTFVCVLSACCHAGLVEEGHRYFECMNPYYHITPAMKHYVCMVDLLGRAGRLDEAQDFINKMPVKPDASVWRRLLGACRIYSNINLGERVAERLFELEPKNAAPYVLLSNMYAAAGRWNDSANVWRTMKDRRVKKTPGCSWIEVNKQVHAFVVGKKFPSQMQKIYGK